MSKKTYFFLFFFANILFLSSQESFLTEEIDLLQSEPAIVSVLAGNLICPPVRTSYGYVCPAEGRTVCGFGFDGKLLWERKAPGKLKPFISEGPSDLISGVAGDFIFMMNPSGLVLWKTKADFDILDAPLFGRDGRLFARGHEKIACLGLKGIFRWELSTEEQDTSFPLVPLNDGSLLVFLVRQDKGRTVAIRIDAFGSQKEEIVFSGKVIYAISCEEGVLLAFADGSIGLCRADEKGASSAWSFSPRTSSLKKASGISVSGKKACFVYQGYAIYVDLKTGCTLTEFPVDIDEKLILLTHTAQGLILASSSRASCYNENGKLIWTTKLNLNEKWNFVFPSDDGYLFFCMNNWALRAYRMRLNFASKPEWNGMKVSSYFESGKLFSKTTFQVKEIEKPTLNEMHKKFASGFFGSDEEVWLSFISNELDFLLSSLQSRDASFSRTAENSLDSGQYMRNINHTLEIIELAGESGVFFSELSLLLRYADDPFLLSAIVKSAGKTAFDPEGIMLSAIEYVLKTKASSGEKVLQKEIIDATGEICLYMGRSAFFKQGKEILEFMIGPNFDKEIREYARRILDKIIRAEM